MKEILQGMQKKEIDIGIKKERKKESKKERKKTRRLEFEKFDLRNAKDKQTTTKREKERMSNLKLGIVHHKRPLITQCNAFSQCHLKHN